MSTGAPREKPELHAFRGMTFMVLSEDRRLQLPAEFEDALKGNHEFVVLAKWDEGAPTIVCCLPTSLIKDNRKLEILKSGLIFIANKKLTKQSCICIPNSVDMEPGKKLVVGMEDFFIIIDQKTVNAETAHLIETAADIVGKMLKEKGPAQAIKDLQESIKRAVNEATGQQISLTMEQTIGDKKVEISFSSETPIETGDKAVLDKITTCVSELILNLLSTSGSAMVSMKPYKINVVIK